MAPLKTALLASFALLACVPAVQAGGAQVETDTTCVYAISQSDAPYYLFSPRYPGWETFIGVIGSGPYYTGAGIVYEGGCFSFFIPAKLTVQGGDEVTCLVDLHGTCS